MIPGIVRGPILVSARTGAISRAPAECQVLGDTFGFLVQGLLFGFCVGSLVLKWRMEKPMRHFKTFILDSSKQLVGAGVIHCLNMICAMIFSSFDEASADECAWYWVNIMIDTTFGVLICYGFLRLTEKVFGYDSGHYGKKAETGIDWEHSPDYGKWAAQISAWCVIVCAMKACVVLMMWLWAPFWEHLAILSTHWIMDRKLRLIFVMIVTPTCMNLFQFWVQDSFLKHSKKLKAENEDV